MTTLAVAAAPTYDRYSCRILADSISAHGNRFTTFEITFPRFVLAELNTHKMLSKNAGSSRARPWQKVIDQLLAQAATELPVVHWGRDQAGMKARVELDPKEKAKAQELWMHLRDYSIDIVRQMGELGEPDENGKRGTHKQIVNRLIENYGFVSVIISGTEWDNFFALRAHPDAQPEIHKIAAMMQEAYTDHTPNELAEGEWHLPLIYDEDRKMAAQLYPEDTELALRQISTGRCARVSYLTHDGKRDLAKDISLHDMLITDGHMSPTEHVARAMSDVEWGITQKLKEDMQRYYEQAGLVCPDWHLNQLDFAGNVRGFIQYRKTIDHESNYGDLLASQLSN